MRSHGYGAAALACVLFAGLAGCPMPMPPGTVAAGAGRTARPVNREFLPTADALGCNDQCPDITALDAKYSTTDYCSASAGIDSNGMRLCPYSNCKQLRTCSSTSRCDNTNFPALTTCICTRDVTPLFDVPQVTYCNSLASTGVGYVAPPAPPGCTSCGIGYNGKIACECKNHLGEVNRTELADPPNSCPGINNCDGQLKCGVCPPPCGAFGQRCCGGGCDPGYACRGDVCNKPLCSAVGAPCCDGSCAAGLYCVGAKCEASPVVSALHKLEVRFSDIDDDAYVWLDDTNSEAENAICKVNDTNVGNMTNRRQDVPRIGTCDLASAMRSAKKYHGTLLIKIGNGGGGYTEGKIHLLLDGKEVWSAQKNRVWSHNAWTYRAEFDVDLVAGTLKVLKDSTCGLPTDCPWD